MNEDHAKGHKDDLKGKAKEALGKATGNRDMEAEGHQDQAKGELKKGKGDVKDALKGK